MTDEPQSLGFKIKWLAKAITPPIIVLGVKTLLVRLGLWKVAPSAEPQEPVVEAEQPEWEYVPEGWARTVPGWDTGSVAESYAAKWPEFLEAIAGPGPLGVQHETREGTTMPRDDPSAHNTIVSFAYVLARAAHGRDKLSVLDWGGGLGHYHALGGAVLPEVELDWHCREVPSVAAAGRRVNPVVTFHEDDESALAREYELVCASGALQYAVDWGDQLERLGRAARHLLYVTRLPVALAAESFVVLQRAQAYGYRTEYIGWVLSRNALLARAEELGIDLDREFLIDAWFSVPDAPEPLVGHRGFLFRTR